MVKVNVLPSYKGCALRICLAVHEAFPETRKDLENLFAVAGNLAHESGSFKFMEEIKPLVKGSLGGISFAQWTGVRRRMFMAYCDEHKLHPYSFDAACGFLIYELKNTERCIPKVVAAKATKTRTKLMSKVIAFELGFERAHPDYKHYESRLRHAQQIAQLWADWDAEGRPELPKYRMPRARFSDDFDAKYGSGESDTTERQEPYKFGPKITVPVKDETDPMPESGSASAELPAPRSQAGKWPEQLLARPEVEAIQSRLRELGFVSVGKVDGRWGDATTAALSAFQKKAGLDVDGHYGPATRKALMVSGQAPTATVADNRARATAPALRAVGEPTTVAAGQVKAVTGAIGIFGGLSGALASLSDYFPNAFEIVNKVRQEFADVPVWVWAIGVVLVAWVLYQRATKIETVRVAEERSGANLALGVTLPEDKLAPPPPEPVQSALARYDRAADGAGETGQV